MGGLIPNLFMFYQFIKLLMRTATLRRPVKSYTIGYRGKGWAWLAKHTRQSGVGVHFCAPFPDLAELPSADEKKLLKQQHPTFAPHSPSYTPLPHTPHPFIAGSHHYWCTCTRTPLVSPSFIPLSTPK